MAASRTVKDIARFIGGEIIGDSDVLIRGANSIEDAGEGEISFIADKKSLSFLEKTNASCVIVAPEVTAKAIPLIKVPNPSTAFVKIVSALFSRLPHPTGIHKTAVIGKTAAIGKDAAVGAYSVIEEGALIADRTVIYPFCYIGVNAKIGADTVIYPSVTIREEVSVGNRVIIHPGAVIGSDGFGYYFDKDAHVKIPQIGTVIIEDDVEIGANTAIDRARLAKTIIKQGTKIDNLVQIAHNVKIGKHCVFAAQVGIAGSTEIGSHAIFGGQAGAVDHVKIGDRVQVGAQGGVTKNIPADTIVWGIPARPLQKIKKQMAATALLPKLFERVKSLEKKVEELERT